jgi:hypothetical protein
MSKDTNDQVSDQDQSIVSDEDSGNSNDAAFKKLLGQRKADQEKLRALTSELESFKSEKQKLEEEKMKHEGNFKALLESREKELEKTKGLLKEFESKIVTFEEAQINQKKINAFNKAVGGRLVNDKLYSLVPLEKIALTDEGEIDMVSLKSVADEYVKEFKYTIGTPKGKMPDGAPQSPKGISPEIDKMTPSELENYIKEKAAKGQL